MGANARILLRGLAILGVCLALALLGLYLGTTPALNGALYSEKPLGDFSMTKELSPASLNKALAKAKTLEQKMAFVDALAEDARKRLAQVVTLEKELRSFLSQTREVKAELKNLRAAKKG